MTEWVSQWVTDKHSQWSGSGPIKKLPCLYVVCMQAWNACSAPPFSCLLSAPVALLNDPHEIFKLILFWMSFNMGGCLFNFWFWIIYIIRGTTFETFWFESSLASYRAMHVDKLATWCWTKYSVRQFPREMLLQWCGEGWIIEQWWWWWRGRIRCLGGTDT